MPRRYRPAVARQRRLRPARGPAPRQEGRQRHPRLVPHQHEQHPGPGVHGDQGVAVPQAVAVDRAARGRTRRGGRLRAVPPRRAWEHAQAGVGRTQDAEERRVGPALVEEVVRQRSNYIFADGHAEIDDRTRTRGSRSARTLHGNARQPVLEQDQRCGVSVTTCRPAGRRRGPTRCNVRVRDAVPPHEHATLFRSSLLALLLVPACCCADVPTTRPATHSTRRRPTPTPSTRTCPTRTSSATTACTTPTAPTRPAKAIACSARRTWCTGPTAASRTGRPSSRSASGTSGPRACSSTRESSTCSTARTARSASGKESHRICVAVADSPLGPFKDLKVAAAGRRQGHDRRAPVRRRGRQGVPLLRAGHFRERRRASCT